jgi:hypothetical protein
MNSSSVADQTGKSFKTFILTLSISLIVFSAAYYFISESSASDGSSGTLGAKSSAATPVKETSVFKELSETPSNVEERAVLALTDAIGGTDSTVPAATTPATTTTEEDTAVAETTTSTVPVTGTTETTVGLILSALAFAVGFLVIKKDPRKLALRSFESSVLK